MVSVTEKRLQAFNDSLPSVYRWFDKARHPNLSIAEELFSEWQTNFSDSEEVHPLKDHHRPGLILHGPSGAGKTFLACELVRRFFQKNPEADARFISSVTWATETVTRAKNGMLAGWTREQIGFAWRSNVVHPLVILDDLDKAKISPSVESALFDLVEQITANEFLLIVTTNVSSRELVGKFSPEFGAPIVRRLQDFCVPVRLGPKTKGTLAGNGNPTVSHPPARTATPAVSL